VDTELSTTIPHSSFGAPRCCGCLDGIVRGDQGEIVCTECNAVIRSVASTELRQTLTEMELSLELSRPICPNCGAVKVALFSDLLAFTCEQCGSVTKLANDPMIDRLFG
jgi:ribosomal protein S27AE